MTGPLHKLDVDPRVTVYIHKVCSYRDLYTIQSPVFRITSFQDLGYFGCFLSNPKVIGYHFPHVYRAVQGLYAQEENIYFDFNLGKKPVYIFSEK